LIRRSINPRHHGAWPGTASVLLVRRDGQAFLDGGDDDVKLFDLNVTPAAFS
jgi:hypothetical protein